MGHISFIVEKLIIGMPLELSKMFHLEMEMEEQIGEEEYSIIIRFGYGYQEWDFLIAYKLGSILGQEMKDPKLDLLMK